MNTSALPVPPIPPTVTALIDEAEREALASIREPPLDQEHAEVVIMRLCAQLRILLKKSSPESKAESP